KTDRIDARVIAHFAEAVKPAPRPLPDAETQELRALLVRRRQLVEMVSAERARLDTAPRSIQDAIQAHIAWLTTQIAGLDDALTACMHKLLTIMNAMVRDLKPWQPQEVPSA